MKAGAALRTGAAFLGIFLSACAPLPQYTRLPVVQYPSVNFNERRPNFVILHHTGDTSASGTLATLTRAADAVSAHYLIARDGILYYLVDEMKRAWHAGNAYWSGELDMNSASIGIELDNDGAEPYPDIQIQSLLALLADLKDRYHVPAANFIGHGDIAPGRKVDPGVNFPWRRLAESGFGLWCEPPNKAAPRNLETATLLGIFGYDTSDYEAAIGAFNRHFSGVESRLMGDEERARLYCLVMRKWPGWSS